MATAPCRVYYPRKNKPPKELTANSAKELAALLRIGWSTEKPVEGK